MARECIAQAAETQGHVQVGLCPARIAAQGLFVGLHGFGQPVRGFDNRCRCCSGPGCCPDKAPGPGASSDTPSSGLFESSSTLPRLIQAASWFGLIRRQLSKARRASSRRFRRCRSVPALKCACSHCGSNWDASQEVPGRPVRMAGALQGHAAMKMIDRHGRISGDERLKNGNGFFILVLLDEQFPKRLAVLGRLRAKRHGAAQQIHGTRQIGLFPGRDSPVETEPVPPRRNAARAHPETIRQRYSRIVRYCQGFVCSSACFALCPIAASRLMCAGLFPFLWRFHIRM